MEEAVTHDLVGRNESGKDALVDGEGKPFHVQVCGVGILEPLHVGLESIAFRVRYCCGRQGIGEVAIYTDRSILCARYLVHSLKIGFNEKEMTIGRLKT